jgi:hypothetical protein
MTTGHAMDPTAAARELLSRLDDRQRGLVRFRFDPDRERRDWTFGPRAHQPGLTLHALTRGQRHAVLTLVSTALSRSGFGRAVTIIGLDDILYQSGDEPDIRDVGNYAFCLFGEPTDTGAWGWRFQGHHVSINATVVDGRTVSTTPMFLGSNPSRVHEAGYDLVRPLGDIEDLARALLVGLPTPLRERAVVSPTPPLELVTGQRASISAARGELDLDEIPGLPIPLSSEDTQTFMRLRYDPDTPIGLLSDDMDEEGRVALRRCLHAHASIGPVTFQPLDSWIDQAAFAWAGSLERDRPHYFRFQAPGVLIEYDNVQNGGRHVHLVHRRSHLDFGADVLSRHRGSRRASDPEQP